MRDGLACKDRWKGALVAAVALLLATPAGDAEAQGGAPGTAGGEDRRIVYDFTRGVEPSEYVIVRGEDSGSLKLCQASADARRDVKDRAYEDAFRKVDAMGRTYEKARPHYKQGFHRLTEKNDQTILREDIRFLRAAEVYDHKRSQYRYVVDLAIRRLPRLVPELERELDRFLQGTEPGPEGNEIVFDLNKIVGRLEQDGRFTSELRRLLEDEKFRSSIVYKDDDTQNFMSQAGGGDVRIHGYPPGQYSVNSLIGSIIERSVAAKVKTVLKGYRRVTVICEGATDSLQIHDGIGYKGKARVGRPGEKLRPGTQDGAELLTIHDNLDLSFARGYEGIHALAQVLGPVLESGRIDLLYTGNGIVADAGGSQPESRRITFRLILGPKL